MKIVLNSKGSGRGLSHWGKFLKDPCMRRIRLSEENEQEGESSDTLMRGSIFHKLAELYHKRELNSDDLASGLDFVTETGETHPGATGKAISEAIQLMTYWVTGCPPDGLGKVIGTEVKFPVSENGIAAVKTALPFLDDDFTGAADIVTEIRSMAESANVGEMFTQFGAPLKMELDPGIWLWDFKTLTDLSMSYKFESGYQEINYPWMFALDNPDLRDKIRGIAYIGIATGRKRVMEPSIDVIIHPFPHDQKIEAMLRRINAAKRVRDALLIDPDMPNREACAPRYPNGSWCPHLESGQCDGY